MKDEAARMPERGIYFFLIVCVFVCLFVFFFWGGGGWFINLHLFVKDGFGFGGTIHLRKVCVILTQIRGRPAPYEGLSEFSRD